MSILLEAPHYKPGTHHKAAATLPSQVVREVDPFAHFASHYRKQQGSCHLACGLAAALQERDRHIRPGFRNTPGLASSGRVRSCSVPFSNIPVRRWVSSSPHRQLCSPLCTWRTPPAPAPPGWPSWAPGRSVTGTVHQWQQQEAVQIKQIVSLLCYYRAHGTKIREG